MTIDEDFLRDMAKARGVTIDSVKVIDTDPFHITPANRRDADWFVEIWHKLNLQPGQYLHGIHYKIISQHEHFHLPPGVYGGERYQSMIPTLLMRARWHGT